MKKTILVATLVAVWACSAYAQEVETGLVLPTSVYYNDSTRFDVYVPVKMPGSTTLEWRGFGSVLNPQLYFEFLKNAYPSNSTSIHDEFFNNSQSFTDSAFVADFQSKVISYGIDTILTYLYPNPSNTTAPPPGQFGVFEIYTTDYDFNSSAYKTNGLRLNAVSIEEDNGSTATTTVGETTYSVTRVRQDVVNGSDIFGNIDFGNQTVRRNLFAFGDEPVEVNDPSKSIIWHYQNPVDVAGAYDTSFLGKVGSQYQQMIGYQEYANPAVFGETGTPTDRFVRKDGLVPYKVLGTMLLRNLTTEKDELRSTWTLSFSRVNGNDTLVEPLRLNPSGIATGFMVVDTSQVIGDVRYHFGRATDNEGLGNVYPNPVRSGSRVPFAVNKPAPVSIEIYSTNGELANTVITNERYIPGNYSFTVPVEILSPGSYVVRMSVGEDIYTTKFNITK